MIRQYRRRPLTVLLAACLGLISCGTQPPSNPPSSPFGRFVTIGILTDQPGWGYQQNLKRSGFDYDLANWIALKLNFEPTWVDIALADREQFLKSGKVQMEFATYSITDDRAKRVGFAGPYMLTQQGVMVRTGDNRIQLASDLGGKVVCTASGTTSLNQLGSIGNRPTIQVKTGFGECVDELLKGQVDAVSSDQLILYGYAQAQSGLHVLPTVTFGNQERYGIGLPHGDVAKCQKLTSLIREFIATGAWNQFFSADLPSIPSYTAYRPAAEQLDPCD